MKTFLRFATLLLTAALALPAERNVSGAPAGPVRDGEWACSHAAKPNRKAAFRVLGKVNPLRLLRRLDTATTDLAIRFSSWHTDLPATPEMPKAAKGTAPPTGEPSEQSGGWPLNHSRRDHDHCDNIPMRTGSSGE